MHVLASTLLKRQGLSMNRPLKTLMSWMQVYTTSLVDTKDAGAWRMLGVFNEMASCAIVSCTLNNVENKTC